MHGVKVLIMLIFFNFILKIVHCQRYIMLCYIYPQNLSGCDMFPLVNNVRKNPFQKNVVSMSLLLS